MAIILPCGLVCRLKVTTQLCQPLASNVAIQVASDVANESYRWAPIAGRSWADLFIHLFTRNQP